MTSSAQGLLLLDLGALMFARADPITPSNANELGAEGGRDRHDQGEARPVEEHGGGLVHGGRRRVVEGSIHEDREGWFPNKWAEVLERRKAKKID